MSNYFNKVPNFNMLVDYLTLIYRLHPCKNLLRRVLSEKIFQDLAVFSKYKIINADRPDNVAFDFYGDSSLDWLVLACNNIVNIKTE